MNTGNPQPAKAHANAKSWLLLDVDNPRKEKNETDVAALVAVADVIDENFKLLNREKSPREKHDLSEIGR